MSKKLLMNAGDAGFGGPIIYETVSGTDIIPTPSDPNRVLAYDKTVYLEEFFGGQSVVNELLATIGSENPDGTYTYKIKATSVKNPNKSKTISIKLDINIVGDSRFYWDDISSCYCIEKSWDFVRIKDTSQLSVQNNPINTSQKLFGWIDTRYDIQHNNFAYAGPTNTVSNWTIYGYNNLANYDPYPKAVTGFLGNGTWGPGIYVKGITTLEAMETYLQSNPPAEMVMKLVSSAVEKFPTNITTKIKLPQFDGGTTYSIIPSVGNFTSSLTVSIPTIETKYLPYQQILEGTDVTVNVDDNYTVDPDGKIYLEWFKANEDRSAYQEYYWPLMGVQDDDYNFEYQIVVTSPDGTIVDTVEFKIDYQIINYNLTNENGRPRPIVEWSNELRKYIFKTSHNYVKITNLDYHPLLGGASTFATTSHTGKSMIAFRYTDVPYMDNSVGAYGSAGDIIQGFVNQENSTCNTAAYYLGQYAYRNHVVYYQDDPTGFSLGLRSTDASQDHTWFDNNADANEHLKTYPVELVYNYAGYEKTYVTHETILNKKVELPYYGSGTTYSMQRLCKGNNTIYKAPICISVPIKYDFKLAYKIFDGRDISIKTMDGRIVRYDQPGYLLGIRGDNILYFDNTGETVDDWYPVINLLGNRQTDGQYSYNVIQTLSSGKEITSPFKIPYMLGWWSVTEPTQYPKPENAFENPAQQDILYWDFETNSYKIEKRTEYYFANSAYNGDIEFVPCLPDNNGIGEGAWRFPIEGRPFNNTNSNYAPTVYSSYKPMEVNYVVGSYNYHKQGAIFSGGGRDSEFPYNYALAIYTTAKTLDELDIFLHDHPLHVIAGSYYNNSSMTYPYPIRDTGVRKLMKLKISEDDANNGTMYSVTNGDLSAQIKIAVPVSYTDIDLPTPDYDLGAPKDFNGNNTYVNTNVQLFNEAKDFTILLDYQHYCSEGTYVADNRTVLHCRYENTGANYLRCGLAVETLTAPSAAIQCATDYTGNVLASPGQLTMYKSKDSESRMAVTLYRYRIMIIYKAGIPYRVIQAGEGDILFDYPLESRVPPFRAHTRPLYLGCQNSTSNARSKYFAGRINECKIWNGVALTEGQILRALGDGPYPPANYTIADCACSSSNRVNTGVNLFDIYKDFTIAIKFKHDVSMTGASGEVLCVGCGDSNIFRLRIHYTKDTDSYNIEISDSNLASFANLLANNVTLPKDKNGDVCIFIAYRSGSPKMVIDYSTGKAVSLRLAETLPGSNPSTFSVTLGYRQQNTNDTTKTSAIWDGLIHNCMIWNGKILNEYEMDYVYQDILK